ncbi:DUF6246 family protein [Salmonella enterica]|uniref:DUF6246 family protein n=1 Tax=Salmonella enterica TaxID=28901 RepID=UPI003167815B|nr:hypothetical protein [Salmonella enterica]
MIITDIGHLSIRSAEREYVLRPTFQAMTRIGSPERIIEVMAAVFGSRYPQHRILNAWIARAAIARGYAETVSAAATIMQACCDEDITPVIGEYRIQASGKLFMRAGRLPPNELVILARHLMTHGVLGDQPPVVGEGKGEYSPRFDARSWVYLAVAHLGVSESEAWGMTMTGLRAALAAKYPQKEKPKIPTEEEYDEFMEMADALMAADSARTENLNAF